MVPCCFVWNEMCMEIFFQYQNHFTSAISSFYYPVTLMAGWGTLILEGEGEDAGLAELFSGYRSHIWQKGFYVNCREKKGHRSFNEFQRCHWQPKIFLNQDTSNPRQAWPRRIKPQTKNVELSTTTQIIMPFL